MMIALNAISLMLLFSLWQGLVLAAYAGCVMLLTRNKPAAVRYRLLSAGLLMFAAATVLTAIAHGNSLVGENVATLPATSRLGGFDAPIMSLLDGSATGYGVLSWPSLIVCCWLAIVALKCSGLYRDLRRTQRVKNVEIFAPGREWQQRVDLLAKRLGIHRGVTLLQSGLAGIPQVIGHLKPVILVPVGLLASLPPEQVEAILLHELAHIRRGDYLVNLLQHVLEILFFFNPAVLWVSRLVSAEREHCCDELCIAHATETTVYIRALLACEHYREQGTLALAANGGKLLKRVQRMASTRKTPLNVAEKSALAVCVAIAILAGVNFAVNPAPRETADRRTFITGIPGYQPAAVDGQGVIAFYQPKKANTNTYVMTEDHPAAHAGKLPGSVDTPPKKVENPALLRPGKLLTLPDLPKATDGSAQTVQQPDQRQLSAMYTRLTGLQGLEHAPYRTEYPDDHAPYNKQNSQIDWMASELLRRGVIADTRGLRVELSDDLLRVNGVVQDDALHELFVGKVPGMRGTFSWITPDDQVACR